MQKNREEKLVRLFVALAIAFVLSALFLMIAQPLLSQILLNITGSQFGAARVIEAHRWLYYLPFVLSLIVYAICSIICYKMLCKYGNKRKAQQKK